MLFNRDNFIKFVSETFNNNHSKCAKALNVNASTIGRIINNSNNAGTAFLNKLLNYCNTNNLDFGVFFEISSAKMHR